MNADVPGTVPNLRFAGESLVHFVSCGEELVEIILDRPLIEFSDAGLGYVVGDCDIIREHPFGDLAFFDALGFEEREDVVLVLAGAGNELYDCHRSLAPFGMRNADVGGFEDEVGRRGQVFE